MKAEFKFKSEPGDVMSGAPYYQEVKRDAIIEALWHIPGLSLKDLDAICFEINARVKIVRSSPEIK
jgi:hypothetical protein